MQSYDKVYLVWDADQHGTFLDSVWASRDLAEKHRRDYNRHAWIEEVEVSG